MIAVADLLVIAFDVDVPAVVTVVRRHALAFRAQPEDYSRAERAVLAEAVRWRRTDTRPPVPRAFLAALAEALQRETPGVTPERARQLAEGCLVQAEALRSAAR